MIGSQFRPPPCTVTGTCGVPPAGTVTSSDGAPASSTPVTERATTRPVTGEVPLLRRVAVAAHWPVAG